MKEIEIKKWKEVVNNPNTNKEKVVDASTVSMMNTIISIALNNEKLTGFDNVRMVNRIGKAFDEIKNDKIIFDDSDFEVIKNWFDKYTPAQWGGSKDIMDAIKPFMG